MGVLWYFKKLRNCTATVYDDTAPCGAIIARPRSYCENTHILRILITNL